MDAIDRLKNQQDLVDAARRLQNNQALVDAAERLENQTELMYWLEWAQLNPAFVEAATRVAAGLTDPHDLANVAALSDQEIAGLRLIATMDAQTKADIELAQGADSQTKADMELVQNIDEFLFHGLPPRIYRCLLMVGGGKNPSQSTGRALPYLGRARGGA